MNKQWIRTLVVGNLGFCSADTRNTLAMNFGLVHTDMNYAELTDSVWLNKKSLFIYVLAEPENLHTGHADSLNLTHWRMCLIIPTPMHGRSASLAIRSHIYATLLLQPSWTSEVILYSTVSILLMSSLKKEGSHKNLVRFSWYRGK